MSTTKTGSAEWRSYFMVPLAAALGYSTSVIHIYGLGPYFEPIQNEFGWSRAQIAVGLTIQTLVSAVFCVPLALQLWSASEALTGVRYLSDASIRVRDV